LYLSEINLVRKTLLLY